jgi:hypothetical protein
MLKKTQRVVNCRVSTKLFLPLRCLPRSLSHLLIAGGFSGCCRQGNRLTAKRTVGFPEMPMFVMFVPAWKHGIKDISIKYVYLTVHLSNCTCQPSHLLPAGFPFGTAKAERRWRLRRHQHVARTGMAPPNKLPWAGAPIADPCIIYCRFRKSVNSDPRSGLKSHGWTWELYIGVWLNYT